MSTLPPFSFSEKSATSSGETPRETITPRPKRRGRPPSIGIRLGPDGKADTENMTPEQIAKARKALSGTSILTSDDQKKADDIFKVRKESYKPLVKPLLSLIGTVESAFIQASRKCSKESADVFKYTDAEIETLEDPTAAVIAKHGSRFEGYEEELTFLLFFTQIFHEKIRVFNELESKKKSQNEQEKKNEVLSKDIKSLEQEQKPLETKSNGTVTLRQ